MTTPKNKPATLPMTIDANALTAAVRHLAAPADREVHDLARVVPDLTLAQLVAIIERRAAFRSGRDGTVSVIMTKGGAS